MTPAAVDSPPRGDRAVARPTWRSALVAALVVTLVRPASWAVGLAGFLARGGIVLLALPILVLPTPSGLANVLGGPLSSIVFGTPSAQLVALVVGAGLAAFAMFVAGTLAAAWAERAGIVLALEAAEDEGIVTAPPEDSSGIGRIAVLRTLGLLPLALALVLAGRPIYDAIYRELVLPDELVTPIGIRVLGDVPELVIAILGAWMAGDAAASVGVRRLVLEGRSLPVAWALGWADLVRRPVRVLGTETATLLFVGLLLVPALGAASIGWDRVRASLATADVAGPVIVAVGVWIAMWLGGLVLAGAGAAFRNAAWTMELVRRAR